MTPHGRAERRRQGRTQGVKPRLLKCLSSPHEEPQEAPERESVARWAGPGLIKTRDPFTGEWHEWQAAECLTGVVAEADRLRKSS